MKTIDINIPEQKAFSYPVIIGENLLERAQEYISQYTKAKKFLVVTNETVYPIFKDRLKLSNAEFCILPDGEEYKNIDEVNEIINKAVEYKLDRTDAIVALGGGVIGDMAGFAAAIYQRGIDYIQIPTTLLSQVDSSVGGKVAVNHKEGKNLIGNFYQPKLVLSDISSLNTLDLRQFKTGLAEILKYSFIENTCGEKFNLFEFLKRNREKIYQKEPEILAEMILICCKMKSIVVNKDEKEKGLRAILNFGHTFAHAIEKVTDYSKYTHGEAVSIGMNLIFEFAKANNFIDENYTDECIGLLRNYELKTEPDERLSPEKLFSAMTMDKKVEQGTMRFVIPQNDFRVEIRKDITKEQIIEFLNKH